MGHARDDPPAFPRQEFGIGYECGHRCATVTGAGIVVEAARPKAFDEMGEERCLRALLHHDVLDSQDRARVEVRDVEDEDGLHAFGARVPAVFVDVPDRLPALIE